MDRRSCASIGIVPDPTGNYGELAMITLPIPVVARFVILGIVNADKNPCLKVCSL